MSIRRFMVILACCLMLAACATDRPSSRGLDQSEVDSSVNIDNRTQDSEKRKRARIRMQLAVSYFQDGKPSIALDEIKESLKIDPSFGDAYGVLALIYMQLSEKGLAEQSFQRALQLRPGDPDINNNYGWFLCQNGGELRSIPYFIEATKDKLYVQPAKPWQNAGVCAMRGGDRVAAEKYFRRSFELDPSGVISAFNLGQIYYDRGDAERARFYVGLVNKSPGITAISLWLGVRIERKLGNSVDQSSLETQLRRSFPDSREAQLLTRGVYDD